jgi:HK97 family phage major capsid protein/HK97 family phage prohead protease
MTTNNRHMTRATELRVTGEGHLAGYAAVFNIPADGLPFTETLAPGCFARSLESGTDVLACVDHDPGKLLGRTSSGTLTLGEDKRGLFFDIDLPKTQLGRDVTEQVKRGDLAGCSFAFDITQDECALLDVSVCALPCYGATSVSLRSDQTRTGTMNDSDIAAQLDAARSEQRAIADKELSTITQADEQRFGELDTRVADLEKSAKWLQRRSTMDTATAAPVVVSAKSDTKSDELRSLHTYLTTGREARSNNTGTPSAGGYMVPDFWSDQVIDKVREIGSVMALANVQQIAGDTKYAIVSSRPSFEWVAEGAAPTDSAMVFSQATVGVNTCAGRVPVTRDLLADSIGGFNEAYLQGQMAAGLSEAIETVLHAGTGAANTPDGIGTAVVAGNQVTAAGAAAIAVGDVFDTYTALGSQYRANGTWLVSPSFLDEVRQLTSSTNYIWRMADDPGIANGYIGNLLGRPVVVSTYLDAVATGNTVAYFGDFSAAFLVGMRGGVEIVSDPYTLANQRTIALNMWQRLDTAVLDSSALANLTMA